MITVEVKNDLMIISNDDVGCICYISSRDDALDLLYQIQDHVGKMPHSIKAQAESEE
jgi:hypothetical protein